MATFGDMKTRIADQLARSDLTTQINSEVLSAISFYQAEKFWFNERRSVTFTTVAGQEFYSSADITDFNLVQEIDQITVTVNGNRFKVYRRPYEELEVMSVTPTTQGEPNYFAVYAQQLRLYPIPQEAYDIRISGQFQVAAPTSDSASNAWTNEAEELIRARATAKVALNILKDDDEATRQRAIETDCLANMRYLTSKYLASGQIVGAL